MIQLNNVSKKYDGYQALEGLNMEIPSGSIYGLIGINGSGKTTIIRILCGVLQADEGEILFDGESVWENDELKQKLGIIPDTFHFPASYSLEDMRRLYAGIYLNWNEDRFNEMVNMFKLNPKAKLRGFSKGMKRQAAFCLTMSCMPQYLLLDEPIDGLDPIVRKMVWKFIIDDVADRNMTVLVSSHNLKEIEGICDRVGILSDKKMRLERDMESLKGDLHKIQISFGSNRLEEDPYEKLDVLHQENWGSVDLLLVKGSEEEVRATVEPYHPVIFDVLPLTLEEVFIYELGGDDDEIRELIF